MAGLKGKKEFDKFEKGEKLTFKGAIFAHCYVCNGLNEGGVDCQGYSCPLYVFFPYKKIKIALNELEVANEV